MSATENAKEQVQVEFADPKIWERKFFESKTPDHVRQIVKEYQETLLHEEEKEKNLIKHWIENATTWQSLEEAKAESLGYLDKLTKPAPATNFGSSILLLAIMIGIQIGEGFLFSDQLIAYSDMLILFFALHKTWKKRYLTYFGTNPNYRRNFWISSIELFVSLFILVNVTNYMPGLLFQQEISVYFFISVMIGFIIMFVIARLKSMQNWKIGQDVKYIEFMQDFIPIPQKMEEFLTANPLVDQALWKASYYQGYYQNKNAYIGHTLLTKLAISFLLMFIFNIIMNPLLGVISEFMIASPWLGTCIDIYILIILNTIFEVNGDNFRVTQSNGEIDDDIGLFSQKNFIIFIFLLGSITILPTFLISGILMMAIVSGFLEAGMTDVLSFLCVHMYLIGVVIGIVYHLKLMRYFIVRKLLHKHPEPKPELEKWSICTVIFFSMNILWQFVQFYLQESDTTIILTFFYTLTLVTWGIVGSIAIVRKRKAIQIQKENNLRTKTVQQKNREKQQRKKHPNLQSDQKSKEFSGTGRYLGTLGIMYLGLFMYVNGAIYVIFLFFLCQIIISLAIWLIKYLFSSSQKSFSSIPVVGMSIREILHDSNQIRFWKDPEVNYYIDSSKVVTMYTILNLIERNYRADIEEVGPKIIWKFWREYAKCAYLNEKPEIFQYIIQEMQKMVSHWIQKLKKDKDWKRIGRETGKSLDKIIETVM